VVVCQLLSISKCQLTLPTSGYLETFKVGSNVVFKTYTSNPDTGPKRFCLENKFLKFKDMKWQSSIKTHQFLFTLKVSLVHSTLHQ
jgi:hypothetical protein